MKKIIFTLIISLSLITGVNAASYEEYNTCYDEFKIADSLTFSSTSNYHSRMLVKLPLENNLEKTYYLKFFNLDSSRGYDIGSSHYIYDADGNLLSNTGSSYLTISEMSDTGVVSYKQKATLENVSYFYLAFYVNNSGTFTTPNKDAILTLSEYELTTCPTIEPEEPEIIADTTLNDFYSIYTSKIQQISQYAQENKFILGATSIVLLIVIVNLFLYLFNKGGYKR